MNILGLTSSLPIALIWGLFLRYLVRGCPYIMLSMIIGGGSGKRLCQYNMVDLGGILNYKVNMNINKVKNYTNL